MFRRQVELGIVVPGGKIGAPTSCLSAPMSFDRFGRHVTSQLDHRCGLLSIDRDLEGDLLSRQECCRNDDVYRKSIER